MGSVAAAEVSSDLATVFSSRTQQQQSSRAAVALSPADLTFMSWAAGPGGQRCGVWLCVAGVLAGLRSFYSIVLATWLLTLVNGTCLANRMPVFFCTSYLASASVVV